MNTVGNRPASGRCWPGLLTTLTLVWAGSAQAAAQVLRGTVLADSVAVAGATVAVSDSAGTLHRAESDAAGQFMITLPARGVYGLTVEKAGYLTAGPTPVDVGFEEEVSLTIRLATIYVLDPIEVSARRNYSKGALRESWEERVAWMERLGIGRHLTREDIDQRPGTGAADLLRGIARVRVVRDDIVFTGSRGGCNPQVYVDAIRDVGRQGILSQLASHDIEAVEVYRSAAETPPEYLDPEACGVVLFWTRRNLGDGGRRLSLVRVIGLFAFVGLMLLGSK